MLVRTIFEAILVVLVVVGFLNERKLVAWEQKIFAAIKRKIQNHKAISNRKKLVVLESK